MNKIVGKDISLKPVREEDAAFILDLRTDKELGKYLSATEYDLEKQIGWIRSYIQKEKQKDEFYFIIQENSSLNRIGTIRLYNIDKELRSFTFGSFIINKALTNIKSAAPKAMNLVLNFAFEELGLEDCFFDCRIGNHKANQFYERFGAKVIKKDEIDIYYHYSKNEFKSNPDKLL